MPWLSRKRDTTIRHMYRICRAASPQGYSRGNGATDPRGDRITSDRLAGGWIAHFGAGESPRIRRGCSLTGLDRRKQRGAGLREILDGLGEPIAVGLFEGDRQREHAAFGKPDAASGEVEPEEVAQRGV